MSSRSSQRSVVNSVYGDRPIVDLPSLGGHYRSTHIEPSFGGSEFLLNTDSYPVEQYYQPSKQNVYGYQPRYDSNIISTVPYSDYRLGDPYNIGNQNEVHYYYGPNGEMIPGPQKSQTTQIRTRLVTNFAVEGKLEYGNMVSVKIRSGNITFHDIPDFVLADIKRAYRFIPEMKVIIVAEGGEYSVYSEPINTTDNQSLSDDGY